MSRSAEYERRLDAYVARMRALPPADWGRLDLHAPVEPVIPFASLDGTQPRLPAP